MSLFMGLVSGYLLYNARHNTHPKCLHVVQLSINILTANGKIQLLTMIDYSDTYMLGTCLIFQIYSHRNDQTPILCIL